MKINIDSNKVHSFGYAFENSQINESIKCITEIPGVEFPIVLLPDLHKKPHLEAPTSISVGVNSNIVPTLTTPTLGCAMGIIKTPLTKDELTKDFFDNFYKNFKKDIFEEKINTKLINLVNNFLIWSGIKRFPRMKYDFYESELPEIIKNGARAVLAKYDFKDKILENIEGGGVIKNKEIEMFKFKDLLPRSARKFTTLNIGYGFSGNHFLEFQYVDKIIDAQGAKEIGIKKNQVVILYHGGEGKLSFYIGRYFSNRLKMNLKENLLRFPAKAWFHFSSLKGLLNIGQRWRYYFKSIPFQEIPLSSNEGMRFLAATTAGLNYSYACRVALIRRIIDAIPESFKSDKNEYSLLWDATHTSITKEVIKNKELVIHRSGATKVTPNKPVIVSGHSTVNSYLGIGLAEAENHLFSVDHGAGETIKRFNKLKRSAIHPDGHVTHIYNSKDHNYITSVEHITDEGLKFIIDKLESDKILKPVAMLKPLAVLKD